MRVQKVSHLFAQLKHARIEKVAHTAFSDAKITLDIKRDDLLHPIVSGNKWRKLKHVLLQAETEGFRSIATMGGQYSNLLHAISYLSHCLGWQAHFYVRGHPAQKLTPMLADALRWGAKINYVDRVTFKQLRLQPPKLSMGTLWLPEGGFDQLALLGTVESLMEVSTEYDYLVLASATGTSLAGYCEAVGQLSLNTKVIGIAVLNNDDEIQQHARQLIGNRFQAEVIRGYEFGGYAKSTPALIDFIEQFQALTHIPLEHVYSGKSLYAVVDLAEKGYFPEGSKVLLIHCGGLQGKRA